MSWDATSCAPFFATDMESVKVKMLNKKKYDNSTIKYQ